MTRARDLADLISSGSIESSEITSIDASKLSGTIADARIPNLAASKITSGQFADARIADLAATKLTGSIADARIPASAVSQHATSFDDNAIVNDISTLALRSATAENAIAYNTNSSFVDVFQDSSGIASNTNAPRNTSEFVSTVSSSEASSFTDLTSTATAQTGFGTGNQAGTFPAFVRSDNGGSNGNWFNGSTIQAKSPTITNGFVVDLGGTYSLRGSEINFRSWSTNARINAHYYVFKNLSGTWEYLNGTARGSSSGTSSSTANMTASNGDNIHGINVSTSGIDADYRATQFGIVHQSIHNNGNHYAGISYVDVNGKLFSQTVSATGNFISNVITAPSSTSKMGAIITYQDNAGVNALNTDIVLQLSADNGSNFTTATMTAMPDFATGIKMAKVNDLSVTAGTQLKYKISIANQSLGSKEARIRGVSLQY